MKSLPTLTVVWEKKWQFHPWKHWDTDMAFLPWVLKSLHAVFVSFTCLWHSIRSNWRFRIMLKDTLTWPGIKLSASGLGNHHSTTKPYRPRSSEQILTRSSILDLQTPFPSWGTRYSALTFLCSIIKMIHKGWQPLTLTKLQAISWLLLYATRSSYRNLQYRFSYSSLIWTLVKFKGWWMQTVTGWFGSNWT